MATEGSSQRDKKPHPFARFVSGDSATIEYPSQREWKWLGLVLRQRRLIAAVCLACALSAGMVTVTLTPWYTASATLQVEESGPPMQPGMAAVGNATGGTQSQEYYETQYAILAGRPLAVRVVRSMELDHDPRFAGDRGLLAPILRAVAVLFSGRGAAMSPDPGVDPRAVDRYLELRAIVPVRGSRLVRVEFTSPDPQLAASVANQHVEEYRKSLLDQRLEAVGKTKEMIEADVAQAKGKLDVADAALTAFRKEHGIVTIDGRETDLVGARLDHLNRRFTHVQAERIRLQALYELTRRPDREALPEVQANVNIKALRAELSQIDAEKLRLSEKFGAHHPQMVQLEMRRQSIQGRLRAEIDAVLDGIELAYLNAKGRETELSSELKNQRQTAMEQKDLSGEYVSLAHDSETARVLYTNLLQRLKDVDLEAATRVSNVSIVEPASPPQTPSSPRPLRDVAVAGLIGLLLGIALAWWREFRAFEPLRPARAAHALLIFLCAASLLAGCSVKRHPPPTSASTGPANCLAEANVTRIQDILNARRQSNGSVPNYTVGPGDLMAVTIYNYRPEGGDFASDVRINDQGKISLPMLEPFAVGGESLAEVRETIAAELRKAQILNDPLVSVFLREYQGQPVVVLGSIAKPGMYYLSRGSQNLLDILSQAGGLSDRAGNYVLFGDGSKVDHEKLSFAGTMTATPDGIADSPLAKDPDMISLCIETPTGEPNPAAMTFPLRAGDVIVVPDAGTAYVEGEVDKPGPYPLRRGMTLTQMITTAGGTIYPADRANVRLMRGTVPGQIEEWQFDLDKIREHADPDFRLERDDRVIVPYTLGRKVAYGFYEFVKSIVRFGVGGTVSAF